MNRRPIICCWAGARLLLSALGAGSLWASDWPQLQRDAARTGRSPDEVAPPYRARWLWFGPAGTLRNRLSKPGVPGWTNDLASGVGRSYPMPSKVPFTLAGTMQPIVHRGLVFVASQEGQVFAIREDEGATVWEADLPGGTLATGAAAGEVVVFASLRGNVHGYHTADGRLLWTVPTGRSITGAPCLVGDRVYVANHGGRVLAIAVESGRVLWSSARLGAAVQGSLAATDEAVYVVAEDLKVYRLRASDGQITATRQVFGQSFRLQWPVIHEGKLWVRTAPAWCVGSEGVNDPLLATATSLTDEEEKYLAWLNGRAVFGPFSSSNDWKSFFALTLPESHRATRQSAVASPSPLNGERAGVRGEKVEKHSTPPPARSDDQPHLTLPSPLPPGAEREAPGASLTPLPASDLSEPFEIPCGPSEGCGQPPNPPAVTHRGDLVCWWPTRYPALLEPRPAFGTRYFIDLAAVDPRTGRRKPLADGPPTHVWPMETDNLYALTTGGRFCYWRQRFRGTYAMDLERRRHYQVQVEVRDRDGGVWHAPVMYVDRPAAGLPRTASPATAGRVGATVANGRLYLCESYGVTAIEHAEGNRP